MKKNVLVLLTQLNEKHKSLLQSKAPDAIFTFENNDTLKMEQMQSANIIIGNPKISMLRVAKNLEWLQLESGGVHVDYIKPENLPDQVVLTNASGAYGISISEYMLGVLLEIYLKLHLYRDNQLEGQWVRMGSTRTIYNSTALIVGAGDIGNDFARKLKALGAYTIGIRRSNTNKTDYFDEMHLVDKLNQLLPRADIVSFSLPSTNLTYKILNENNMNFLKKDAVIINAGRGNAIDLEALCNLLESGHLLGAALDVTDPEPLPKEHRLWKFKNAVITPHISGLRTTYETQERIIRICVENLEAFLSGQKMRSIVDKKAGY